MYFSIYTYIYIYIHMILYLFIEVKDTENMFAVENQNMIVASNTQNMFVASNTRNIFAHVAPRRCEPGNRGLRACVRLFEPMNHKVVYVYIHI